MPLIAPYEDPKANRFSFDTRDGSAVPLATGNSRRKLYPGTTYTPGTVASLQLLLETPSVSRNWSRAVLVSPRPLGPTHLIVAYTGKDGANSTLDAVECAVNDAIFTAHVPNLAEPLPRRRDGKLVRVKMRVPQHTAWPELIRYMHKRDVMDLIAALVPEWVLAESFHSLYYGGEDESFENDSLPLEVRACNAAEDVARFEMRERLRSEENIDAAYAALDALRELLEHVGLFEEELWHRLNLYMYILREAKIMQSRVELRVSDIEDNSKEWP